MDRSENMRAIKSRDTVPERLVKKMIRATGHRVRTVKTKVPGSPDIVFFKRKLAIFVDGCFWHGHRCKRGVPIPRTNRPYWVSKIASNKNRDARVNAELSKLGWRVVRIWECHLKRLELVERKIINELQK
jgi:DNA mismatch endonuclease, patch repair protein